MSATIGGLKVLDAWHTANLCETCEGAERWYVRKHRWIARRAKANGVDLDVACAVVMRFPLIWGLA